MLQSFDAIYEDGVLKPALPLPLNEHERVRDTLCPANSLSRQTAGIRPWTGDAEALRRLAEEPEGRSALS